jgi:Tfp pilus assembly protein PilX
MDKSHKRIKGVALVLVLATILVAVILGTAIIKLMSSQARLTHHQLSRIQAYYASQAAINYAREKLRTGAWVPGTDCNTTTSLCNAGTVGLDLSPTGDFKPNSITAMSLVITPSGVGSCGRTDIKACISCTATYTYTTP